jgi:fructan beta-fructosidase
LSKHILNNHINRKTVKAMKHIFILLLSCSLTLIAKAQSPTVTTTEIKSKVIHIKKGQTYLNLPVNSSNRLVRARIKVDGKALDQFTINLAEENPAFWTFFDVTPYQGKRIVIEIENAPVMNRGGGPNTAAVDSPPPPLSSKGLDMIFADSKFPGQDSVYTERGRPQIHFSAQRGWINDPNGLVKYKDEYHLYFQHNPYGWQWGNMHWGHAVSKDLIHWQQLPEAIYPYLTASDPARPGSGDAAFSGCAFVDPNNTGGFRRKGIDPLIVMYTSTGRGECLKLSYDDGRTFEDYAGNPVIKHNGRDPKVFWYEPGNHWVLVVWDQGQPKKIGLGQEVSVRQHSIYTSNDLKTWTYQSGVEGFFECPELFKLPVEGAQGVSKWVMYDAFGRYVVGDFDGKNFKVEQPFKQYEYGGGYFYASQTFSNIPDNKVIQIGWGRNITNPGMPFNQAMLFPTDLRLKKTPEGYTLCPTPIAAIKSLHKNAQVLENKVVTSEAPATIQVKDDVPIHIIAEFQRGDAPITLNILGYELRYDNEWEFSTVSPAKPKADVAVPAGPFAAPTTAQPVRYARTADTFKIEAIVDKNILEFFVNDGELYYVTEFAGAKNGKVEASVRATPGRGGQAISRKFIVNKMEVYELNSIWKK